MKLIRQKVISKATKSEGFITGVKSNGVLVSFTNGIGSIPVPFDKFDDLFIAKAWVSKKVIEAKENIKNTKGGKR